MADYNLGTARGVIEIEYKGDGAKRAREDLKQTGTSAGTTDAKMNKASRGMAVAGAVIAGGFALAVRSAADFESRLSAISAVSGATETQMEAIRGKALQLGKDTAFSAGESAQAMEELIKAGLSVEDVLNGAADATVNLAAAGAVSMPEAATISANAMNQFNLTAKDMVGVVDNIAGAANASAIDVGEFGMSLQQVGAVANLAGVDFKDTATAIALMGNAGIKGSDAGTSLKSMFMRLQPTTDKATSTMMELGLITGDLASANKFLQKEGLGTAKTMGEANSKFQALAASMGKGEVGTVKNAKAAQDLMLKYGGLRNEFYDAEGNTRSLAEVSGKLQGALKGMSKEQKQAALQTLFGSDAIRAAAILSKEGADGFEKMAASMGKVSAADVAKKRMDNFKGSLEQFKGSLETVGITIGTLLLPALRSIVDGLNSLLGGFLALPGGIQTTIVTLIGVVGAFLLIASAVLKFITMSRALTLALNGTRLAFIATWFAALGPIAIVIAALVAIGIAIAILWNKSETFRNIVTAVWEAIKSAAMAVANWFTGPFVSFFTSAWDAIKTGLSAIAGFFVSIWNGIKTAVGVVFSAIGAVIGLYITIWRTIITTALAVIGAVWSAFWGVFGGIIKGVFGLIVAVIRLYLAIVMLVFRTAWAIVKAVTVAAWNAIAGAIRAVWGVIRGIVMAGVNFVRAVVARVWGAIRAVTSAVWNGIMGVIRAVWGRIGGTVMSGINRAKGAITAGWNAAKNLTTSAWNAVVNIVGSKITALIGKVKGIAGKVKGALSGAAGWLVNAGKQIIQGLINGIESMIGKVTAKLNALTQKIKDAKGPEEVDKVLLKSNGQIIMRSLIDGFAHEEPVVLEHLHALTNKIPDAVLTDLSGLASASGLPTLVGAGMPPLATPATGSSLAGVRIVGDLVLRDGKAYISGVALETIDNEDHMAAVRGRMGGSN